MSPQVKEIISNALKEDLGTGDITTELIVSSGQEGTAEIFSRGNGIVAGLDIAREVFMFLDKNAVFKAELSEGSPVTKDVLIASVSAKMSALLAGERTALNFLQRLSGIAGMVASWKKLLDGYPTQLVDTRKTTPGLRQLEKYAVMVGGGRNHRRDLAGGILIKENHIRAAGGIARALALVRKNAPVTLKIEIEVTNIHELEEALEFGADIIMLDNMDTETIKMAVAVNGGKALLEVSGNVTAARLPEIAATGVDFISCGALTHSASILDMSMLIK